MPTSFSETENNKHSTDIPKTSPLINKREIIFLLLLVLILPACYFPAITAKYVWDDERAIINNTQLRTADGLYKIWFHPSTNKEEYHYWPLVYTAFWVEYHLWGMNFVGFHLTNIIFHIANTILLFLLLRRLFIPGAWIAAILFGLHPVHVESVAWMVELKDVLSGTFYLFAFLLFFIFKDNKKWYIYSLSLFLFLCALLTKSITVTLPIALLLIIWWKKEKIQVKDILYIAPFLMIAILYSVGDFIFTRKQEPVNFDFSFLDKILIAGHSVWFYIYKLILPFPLITVYPLWKINTHNSLQYVYPITVVLALIILWLKREQWGKGPLAAILFYIVTLFPVLGFINFGYMDYSFVADRFQYLASIGTIVLIAALATKGIDRNAIPKSLQYSIAAIICIILGSITVYQSALYKTNEILFRHTYKYNPNSAQVNFNLAEALNDNGNPDEAIIYYKNAIKLKADYDDAYNNLGNILARKGNLDEAAKYLQKAIFYNPNYALAHYNLGLVYLNKKDYNKAIKCFLNTLKIEPDNVDAYNNAGLAFLNMGDALCSETKYEQAIPYYIESLKYDPNNASAYNNLALAYLYTGKTEEAISNFRKVLQIDPSIYDTANMLAWILATNNDPKLRNGAEAVELASKVYKVYGDSSPLALDTLAAAYAETGNFDEAIKTTEKALSLAKSKNIDSYIKLFENRLQLYKNKQPLREMMEKGMMQ